ncbi:MAG: hypothetical protein H3C36_14325, partial [Chitinophagaceae bacterium]|nr:hypothetical protein [Chitinophagaceae bacterium]
MTTIGITKRSLFAGLIAVACILTGTTVSGQDLENINLKKPVTFHGNLNLQLEYYQSHGIPARKKDFSWLISGNPVVNVLGVDLPFSFLL